MVIIFVTLTWSAAVRTYIITRHAPDRLYSIWILTCLQEIEEKTDIHAQVQ